MLQAPAGGGVCQNRSWSTGSRSASRGPTTESTSSRLGRRAAGPRFGSPPGPGAVRPTVAPTSPTSTRASMPRTSATDSASFTALAPRVNPETEPWLLKPRVRTPAAKACGTAFELTMARASLLRRPRASRMSGQARRIASISAPAAAPGAAGSAARGPGCCCEVGRCGAAPCCCAAGCGERSVERSGASPCSWRGGAAGPCAPVAGSPRRTESARLAAGSAARAAPGPGAGAGAGSGAGAGAGAGACSARDEGSPPAGPPPDGAPSFAVRPPLEAGPASTPGPASTLAPARAAGRAVGVGPAGSSSRKDSAAAAAAAKSPSASSTCRAAGVVGRPACCVMPRPCAVSSGAPGPVAAGPGDPACRPGTGPPAPAPSATVPPPAAPPAPEPPASDAAGIALPGTTPAGVMPIRRSSRSTRESAERRESSAPGSRMRAHMSSSCRRGEVAPDISVSPVLRRSAARDSSACP